MIDTTTYYNQIQTATAFIKDIYDGKINVALTLGTGLSGIKSDIDILHTIPYNDIPHFPQSTVEGHEGHLLIGNWHGVSVMVMSGRFHCYEGYTAKEVTFPVRVVKELGIDNLWISNVAGGLKAEYPAGTLILIKDHINLMPDHPLIGPNDDRLGIRFPDMKEAYTQSWRDKFKVAAKAVNITFYEGIYASLQGPSLETPSEYNMLHIMGADVVGMSTVPEVIVAKHAEIKTLVCSIVSNVCYPPEHITETTLEEVIAVAHESGDQLKKVWEVLIKKMN